ncbi:class III lanthionine synthetase LanKC [Streptomyces sp. CRN 30]|uniref:class III lanthionine synthetase LanKC n=1 Tax=Streptomyces sp. CRN 30 TaxID=3075613 RepID=UPI002A807CE4|nr:class III lanthionine synthetase LanKC [Streptomyces sp. CRN 30]
MRKFDEYQAAVVADPRFFEPLAAADNGDDLTAVLRDSTGGRVVTDGIWARLRPSDAAPLPPHGWKIHISAVPHRAAETLRAVARVHARTPFTAKALRSTKLVRLSSTRWWTPGQIGKCVTVYAQDADHARHLLGELHTETAGLYGPYVLTDRRYRDSSCLSYRYGQFTAEGTTLPDGTTESTLTGPDGRCWTDDRTPVYRRPPWVPPLLDGEDEAAPVSRDLHGYRVRKVLQFNGTGGTYLAERISDGSPVVLKEARPHTAYADDGSDAQERLRREYAALRTMSDSGVTPRPIELFTEWEHLFLAEEYLPDAVPLIQLVTRHHPLMRNVPGKDTAARYNTVVDRVVAGTRKAIAACHARGLVYGDLSMTNVLVCPDTFRVWLIDFESVRGLDDRQDLSPRTVGFAPPPGSPAAADGRAYDAFGTAAVEAALIVPRTTLRAVSPVAFARSLRHTAARLDRPVTSLLARLELPAAPDLPDEPDVPDLGALARDAMRFTEAVMTPDRQDRLFPADSAVYATNPWSVAHGAAGVVRALHRITGRVPDEARRWMDDTGLDGVPPGLYSGLAGVGWTLCETGQTARGADIVDRAVTLATRTDLPAHVLTGTAGIGLACLAAARATGDDRFTEEAARIGARLAADARDDGAGLHWPPAGTPGRQPRALGYGHGSAGVALFLLYLHLATGDPGFLRLGRRALAHDLAHATEIDGVTGFPTRAGGNVFYPYWERGAAGIGTALARYCAVVDDEKLRHVLDRMTRQLIGGTSVFPGLFLGACGQINLALDHADLGDAPGLRRLAARLARDVAALSTPQPEGTAFPGHTLLRYSTDFATGSAGIALTLDRVHRGGGDFNYTLDTLLPARPAARPAPTATEAPETGEEARCA